MTFLHAIKQTKNRFFIPMAAALVFFVSCGNNDQKEASEAVLESAPQELTLEQKRAQLRNVAPVQTSNATATGNINPPHGQPGHRCDIPVGAPLDGGAATKKPVKVTPSSGEQPINLSGDNAAKPAINPPHGQPGHRCDVKVGDPLP